MYGAQVYVGLQEQRQENKDECNRWKARGDTSEYYAGEAMEGIVWIPQGAVGSERFSYVNTKLPVTNSDAAGRWYPALLVVSVEVRDKVIFECPKIALDGSRVWSAHTTRTRVWTVYGLLLDVGILGQGHDNPTMMARVLLSLRRRRNANDPRPASVTMLAPPRKAKETHDDDGADIMARRNARQRLDAKKPNRSQLENNVEIPEMTNAVVSYGDEGGDQEGDIRSRGIHPT